MFAGSKKQKSVMPLNSHNHNVSSEWERAKSGESDPNYEYKYTFEDDEGHGHSKGYLHSTDSKSQGQGHDHFSDHSRNLRGERSRSSSSSPNTTVPQRYKRKYPFNAQHENIFDTSAEAKATSYKTNQEKTVYYGGGVCEWLRRKWDEIGDISADEQSDIVEGRWDFWKAYYCYNEEAASSSHFNELFLVWSLLYTIGMNRPLDMIYLTQKHGGFAFLFVCLFVYIGVGYPMYVLETMTGQYGGRKPISMLRFMAPALQGIGPALWLRTFMIAVQSLVTTMYGLNYFLDLYVCSINQNELLKKFCNLGNESRAVRNNSILLEIDSLHIGLTDEPMGFILGTGTREWMLVVFALTSIFCLGGLRYFGNLYAFLLKLIYLVWIGYFLYSVLRTFGGTWDSIMYFPLRRVLRTDWMKVFDGKVWMDAIYFVISSLGLVTLVHPFFASRCFYHYRTARDGIIIIFLTIIWNLAGACSVLLFLGYVTVNKKEMIRAIEQIDGPQGLFITYVMKHNQANMLDNLEYDTEFYCGVFYAVTAIMAACCFHSCVHTMVQSSFQEYTSMVMASFVIVILVLLFSIAVPLVFITIDGLRILNLLNFYLHHTFGVIFLSACFFISVACSHGFAKVVYDIRNMAHLTIFEPIRMNPLLSAYYPKFYRWIIIIGFGLVICHSAVQRPYPIAAGVDYSGNAQVVGIICSFFPVISVVFIGVLACFKQKRGWKKSFRPHRDWYKNWYHTMVCFMDPSNLLDHNREMKNEHNNSKLHA